MQVPRMKTVQYRDSRTDKLKIEDIKIQDSWVSRLSRVQVIYFLIRNFVKTPRKALAS